MDPIDTGEILLPQDKTQPLDPLTLACDRKRRRLKWIKAQLGEVPVSLTGELSDNAPSQADNLALVREKKKRLEAELALLKEKEVETLPENAELQHLMLHQEDQDHLQQLNETLAFVRAKRLGLTESINKEKDIGRQLKELNAALKEKVDSVNKRLQSSENDSSTEHGLAELQAEVNSMSSADRSYKKTLIKLLDKHFPLPPEVDEPKGLKNVINHSRSYDVNRLCPISSIVGRLVEQTLNSPANPYIEIDEMMWPPHIEFLLRSQIVRKDPQNSMRIKLCAFHF